MSDLPTLHHPRPPCYPSKDPLLLKQIQMSIRRNIFLVYFLPRDHLAKTEIVENANLWIFFRGLGPKFQTLKCELKRKLTKTVIEKQFVPPSKELN